MTRAITVVVSVPLGIEQRRLDRGDVTVSVDDTTATRRLLQPIRTARAETFRYPYTMPPAAWGRKQA
jgi:hypothetical protein